MTNEERNEIIELCAKECDREAQEWLNFLLSKEIGNDEEAKQHAMSSGMSAGNCAERIRRLNPDYADMKDRFKQKVTAFVKAVQAGDETAQFPRRTND